MILPYPLDCLPLRLSHRYSLSPLTSAIHQTVAEALFLEPIHDDPDAIIHSRPYQRVILQSESTLDPNHNDTAAALTDLSLSPTRTASAGSPYYGMLVSRVVFTYSYSEGQCRLRSFTSLGLCMIFILPLPI
jgi:hypothetical protein